MISYKYDRRNIVFLSRNQHILYQQYAKRDLTGIKNIMSPEHRVHTVKGNTMGVLAFIRKYSVQQTGLRSSWTVA